MSDYRQGDTASWDAEQVRQNHPSRQARQPEQKRRRRRRRNPILGLILHLLFVLLASALLGSFGWMLFSDFCSFNCDVPNTTVQVTSEDDLSSIAEKLEDAGLIEYKWFFKLYSSFTGAEEEISIGSYTLNGDMDYHALVAGMRGTSSSVSDDTVQVTIPEGSTVARTIAILAENGVNTEEALLQAAQTAQFDYDFIDNTSQDISRLEGYLFPDTYTFELGENPKYVLNKMLVNFDAKMDQYLDRFAGEGENAPAYSLHDIVTIASLIEKETDGTNTDERSDYRQIASVIYNRLEHPEAETVGLLQIDATLVYLNGGRVPTEADKAIDSPYNTYKYQGLPKGPISNPGMTSLLAAMDPDSTNYYFYALNPETKQHEYSRTMAEHQAKLDKFAAAGNG